jgi:putative ABC transport system permease protein
VRIYTDAPPNRFRFSVADYQALQAEQTHFEQIAGYTDRMMSFSDGNVAERLRGKLVSWTYFSLLGLRPANGRDLAEADCRPGSPLAVIVSRGFWHQRLAGRVDAIGKTIRIDGADHIVVGVLPQTVGPLEEGQDFFIAAQWQPPRRKGPFFITTLARLRSESERSAAADELRAINRRMFPIWRSSYQDDKATWSFIDLKRHVIGDVELTAGLALAAVALVWLIACANASNLLVARVTSRRRELAVRAALGASRGRVVRYLMAESGVLAIGAASLGVLLARTGVRLLRELGGAYFPRTHEIALDGPVFWLLIGLTAASALLFGVVPAVYGTGGPVDESLRSMGRSSTGSVSVRRLRQILVGSQFAIATPLLVVAGLLLVSLKQLGRVDLGFDTHNVLSGSISLPATQYDTAGRVLTFWDQLQRRLEALPGVSRIAFADSRPPNGAGNFNNFDLEDFPATAGQSQPVTPWVSVSPEYFRLLGLSLLEGRLLEDRDGAAANIESVVVDRAWARRFFPNQSAVGKRFHEGGCTTCPWTTVVGVVSEVKYAGLDKPDDGTVYTALPAQGSSSPARQRFFLARTEVDAISLAAGVRQIVRELDPSVPLSGLATFDDLVDQSLQRPRSISMLVGGFAAVALMLSLVGIYGVMAHYVQQQTKDIGIRLALGGRPGHVLGLIVGEGMKVVAGGVLVGLVVAFGATRVMSSLLFGVGANDAATFGMVVLLMLGVAFVACFVPAKRASGVQPAHVLRNE